jgi:RimJ/RimL family protein N-acetyltransferase
MSEVMPFGWTGKKVRLVPLEYEKHFANALRWLNDPEVTRWLLIGDYPITRVAEEAYFQRAAESSPSAQDPAEVLFAIETLSQEEHIGFAGIHQISFRHGVATTGTVIGRRSLWNRGFGSDAIAVRTRYAFEVLGLRLLLAEVFAENGGSLKALARNGYREVGRIPQRWWKRGALRDTVQLALYRQDWKP